MTPDPLADFRVEIDQVVDWADMDSFGHVNNVVYFRYFENARVEYFRRIGWWEYLAETGIGPIVGSTQARFRRPVKYPDTLRAGAKVVSWGADRFTIRLTGRGGHGAKPEGTTDCVVAAANLVLQLHSIVSRNVSPLDSAVLSIGTMHAGYNFNVVADASVSFRGDIWHD